VVNDYLLVDVSNMTQVSIKARAVAYLLQVSVSVAWLEHNPTWVAPTDWHGSSITQLGWHPLVHAECLRHTVPTHTRPLVRLIITHA
jgi:hypothetical protein